MKMFSSLTNTSKKLSDKRFAAERTIKSSYLKIFTNYSQAISILSYLNFNLNEIDTSFVIFKASSGSIHNVISLECILNGKFVFF